LPLAPTRPFGGIGIGTFCIGGICGGIGTTYFDDGRSGSAVGCLPAPLSLRSSANSRRRLPFSPPNARGPVPLSALYPRFTCGGFEVPFGRSLPKSGRDRPQGHFPVSTTEKTRRREQCFSGGHSAALRDRLQVHDRGTPRKSTHAMCGADRRSPKSRGAPRRRPFQPGRENKSRKRHGLRAPCKKRRERSGGAVQPVTSQGPT